FTIPSLVELVNDPVFNYMVDDTVVEEFRFSRSTRSNHFQHGLHSRRIDSRNGVEVFADKLIVHLRRPAPLAHILFQNFKRLWFPGLYRSDAFDVSGNNALHSLR